jgi:hypothetical protein
MRSWTPAVLLVLASTATSEARQAPTALRDLLVTALKPALPFPDATDDGTAAGGNPEPIWTVRWPEGDAAIVQILANPLNAQNRDRALKAEQAIQKAAMQSQQRSQADYDKAVRDFERTGRTSEIREISLRDDGLAGERYDAESQLTVEAELLGVPHLITVATARLPEAFPGTDGPAAIVRVAANEYQEPGDGATPGTPRFCAEQAWVFVGPVAPPVVARTSERGATVSVARAPASGSGQVVMITIRGNVELVDRVLHRANWALLRAGQ